MLIFDSHSVAGKCTSGFHNIFFMWYDNFLMEFLCCQLNGHLPKCCLSSRMVTDALSLFNANDGALRLLFKTRQLFKT